MVVLGRFGLHRPVGDEPGVAAAARILGMAAAGDVGLVLERHADGQAVQLHVAGQGQVEHVLVVVVEEAPPGQRLVVAHLSGPMLTDLIQVIWFCSTNSGAQPHDQLEWQPWAAVGAGDVEKERGVRPHHPADRGGDPHHPGQVVRLGPAVVVGAVGEIEVIRRRGDDDIDACSGRQAGRQGNRPGEAMRAQNEAGVPRRRAWQGRVTVGASAAARTPSPAGAYGRPAVRPGRRRPGTRRYAPVPRCPIPRPGPAAAGATGRRLPGRWCR